MTAAARQDVSSSVVLSVPSGAMPSVPRKACVKLYRPTFSRAAAPQRSIRARRMMPPVTMTGVYAARQVPSDSELVTIFSDSASSCRASRSASAAAHSMTVVPESKKRRSPPPIRRAASRPIRCFSAGKADAASEKW